jgi:hypothetical protein
LPSVTPHDRRRRPRPDADRAALVDGGGSVAMRRTESSAVSMGRHFAATLTRGFTSNGKPPSNGMKKPDAPRPFLVWHKANPFRAQLRTLPSAA